MVQWVRAPKTAELIAIQLRQRIARRELSAGDALPPEAQLMDQFGVSRPILREAFRILESESLIEVRRGVRGGARVRLPDPRIVARYTALLLQLQGTTLGDVLEARRSIEPAVARIVAEQHSPEALASLRECHAVELRPTTDVRARATATARFHTMLMESCGNTSLALLIGMLSTIIDHHYTLAAERMSPEWRGFSGSYLHVKVAAHGRLLDLIEAGQGDAAEQLWRQHMQESGEWVDELLGNARWTTLVDLLNPSGGG